MLNLEYRVYRANHVYAKLVLGLTLSEIIMVNPLILLLKFAPNALQVISAAEVYGWPRVYRRLCEGTKVLRARGAMQPSQELMVRGVLKESLRFPLRSYELLVNHEVVTFAQNYAERVLHDNNVRIPAFFTSAAKLVIKQTKMGKTLSQLHDLLDKAQKKRK